MNRAFPFLIVAQYPFTVKFTKKTTFLYHLSKADGDTASAHVRLIFPQAFYDAFFAHHFMRNYRYCKN